MPRVAGGGWRDVAADSHFSQKGPEQLAKPMPAFRLKYTPVLHTKLNLAELDLELERDADQRESCSIIFLNIIVTVQEAGSGSSSHLHSEKYIWFAKLFGFAQINRLIITQERILMFS